MEASPPTRPKSSPTSCPTCTTGTKCGIIDNQMEGCSTDPLVNVFVVSSADAAEWVSCSTVMEGIIHKILAELDLVGSRRRNTKKTKDKEATGLRRFPGLPHDITPRPRPFAYTPKLREKHRRKRRSTICTGNLQLHCAS